VVAVCGYKDTIKYTGNHRLLVIATAAVVMVWVTADKAAAVNAQKVCLNNADMIEQVSSWESVIHS